MNTTSLLKSLSRPAIALLLLAAPVVAQTQNNNENNNNNVPDPIGPTLVYQQGPVQDNNTSVALTAGTWVGGSFIPALSTFTYNLNSIKVSFGNGTPGSPIGFSLYSNAGTNSGNYKPGTLLTSLNGNNYYNSNGNYYPYSAGDYTYKPSHYNPSLVNLAPGSTYWLVAALYDDNNGVYNLNAAGTNTPSPGQAAYGTLTGGSFTYGENEGAYLFGDAANRFGNTSLQISVYANPIAFWQGDQGANGNGFWGQISNSNTNFARDAAGTLDYGSLVNEATDVYFSTTNATNKATYLNEGNVSNTTVIHNLIVNDAAGVSISHGTAAAELDVNHILVGTGAQDTGKLTLSGASLTVKNTDDILVGQYGNGELNISNGAKLIGVETSYEYGNSIYYDHPDAYIGLNGTAQGTVTVDGVGSSWTGIDYVYLGSDDSGTQGTLKITNGGSMDVIEDIYAGYYGKGTVEVSGVQIGSNNSEIRSTLNVNSDFYVGYSYDDDTHLSQGTLSILDGALVNVGDEEYDSDMTIGYYGTGTVTVSGVNERSYESEIYRVHSTLNIAGDLDLGYDDALSSGTLNVLAGGIVNVGGYVTVGYDGKGTINVDGQGSVLNMTGTSDFGLYVGYDNDSLEYSSDIVGKVNITSGGIINASDLVEIGYDGTGAVKVDGEGSELNVISRYNALNQNNEDYDAPEFSQLWVGYYNTGTLDVLNGGYAVADEIYIGSDNAFVQDNSRNVNPISSNPGVATVDGYGSVLRAVNNDLYVGYFDGDYAQGGQGTLNLTNGGLAVVGTRTGTYQGELITPGSDPTDPVYGDTLVQDEFGKNPGDEGYVNTYNVITPGSPGSDPIYQQIPYADYGTGTLYLGYDNSENDTAYASGILNIGKDNGTAGFLQATKVSTSKDGEGNPTGTGTINFDHNSSQGYPDWYGYYRNKTLLNDEIRFTPYEFAADITGGITVNQLGTGTTVLTGHSDYTGTTNIKAGTLFVGGYQYFPWLENDYYNPPAPPPAPIYTGTYFDGGRGSLRDVGDITVGTGLADSKGNIIPALLAGNGIIDLTKSESSIIVKNGGGISVASYDSYYQPTILDYGVQADTFRLTTAGEGSIKLEAGSAIFMDIVSFGIEPQGIIDGPLPGRDLTGDQTTADRILLRGVLDATQGGTLVVSNPNDLSGFRAGDKWLLFDLHPTPAQTQGAPNVPAPETETNPGVINGVQLTDLKDPSAVQTSNQIPVNETALHLNQPGVNADPNVYLKGFLDADTGVYELVDWTPQASAQQTGTQTQIQQDQSIISTISNALGDLNGRLYNLRAGGGEVSNDSLAALIDEGVIVGQGDGSEKGPVAKLVHRAFQWEVFTTVSYGYVSLNSIGSQAGVNSQTWSPSVGIERHLTQHLAVGFAASFINTHQTYAQGLGNLDINGLGLSTYASYVTGSLWVDGLYSFGVLGLESSRNPGFAFPVANGDTTAYTNSVQLNGGWNFRFQNNTLVTGPFAGVDYMHASVDAYTESGGGLAALSYASRSFDSLITRLGWSVSKKFNTDFAVITPQVRLSYERQNMTNNNATSASLINLPFTATTQGQSPGQDYMVLGTGVNFQFTDRVSLLLTYQTQLFRQNLNAHFASIRLGYQF